ncbi:response regulator transcription factor [Cognatishimia activa]|uniref:Transcriptional regulatory protein FixJ n=1 Tax=Cognatishimia activa TaxID=1715691 RepID=A0A0N7MBX9_9RHOB|nr:response regulator [Cognatishimia activa]CUI73668.1 Transcriptional regulatory protein FixJ [Cognatishimia activa]CUK26656.1 Transcriptional regulatory protein FixJ [Cognatishimia activa]
MENSIVFLVDDEEEVRATLSRALRKRGFTVVAYESAQAFLDAYRPEQTGCVVLDYGMPEMNGLELQAMMNDAEISIPVIFISGHGGIPETVQAMKAGAVDFLEKPFRQSALVACIESAFERDLQNRKVASEENAAKERFGRLTSREREIAVFMMENPSNTASKEIGRALDISPRTVDHHRARILEKMEIGSVIELVELSQKVLS